MPERCRRCASKFWGNEQFMTTRGNITALCRPEVQSLPTYNAGASVAAVREKYGLKHVTKLASNENPHGASPDALRALRGSLSQLALYPDPRCTALCGQIERMTGIASDRILFGNGSETLIAMICLAVLSAGDRVVTLAPAFGLHEIFPLMMGAVVDKVPVTVRQEFDLGAWQAALAEEAKLVMFSNPSNPVGCCLSSVEFRQLIDFVSVDTLIVIDEAYGEYAAGDHYPESIAVLAAQNRPWIVLRTLSKAYGLAGLRVGYAITSDPGLVANLGKVQTPFSVNVAAQAAALAALQDAEHLRFVVDSTRRERSSLMSHLERLDRERHWGLRIAPSHANFLFIDTGRSSRLLAEQLMRHGVIIKPWLDLGFETCIRVTVGTAADNAHFLDALAEVLKTVPLSEKAHLRVPP
jgi:histidinol-phosphate aminotransferase